MLLMCKGLYVELVYAMKLPRFYLFIKAVCYRHLTDFCRNRAEPCSSAFFCVFFKAATLKDGI